MPIEPHQQRVIDEKNELDAKLEKLRAFIKSNPLYPTLPFKEQGLLIRQRAFMGLYSKVLGERIEAFKS